MKHQKVFVFPRFVYCLITVFMKNLFFCSSNNSKIWNSYLFFVIFELFWIFLICWNSGIDLLELIDLLEFRNWFDWFLEFKMCLNLWFQIKNAFECWINEKYIRIWFHPFLHFFCNISGRPSRISNVAVNISRHKIWSNRWSLFVRW